jgi:hypothetical protein
MAHAEKVTTLAQIPKNKLNILKRISPNFCFVTRATVAIFPK